VARGKEHKARVPGDLQQRLAQQRRDEVSTSFYPAAPPARPRADDHQTISSSSLPEVLVEAACFARTDTHLLFLPNSPRLLTWSIRWQ